MPDIILQLQLMQAYVFTQFIFIGISDSSVLFVYPILFCFLSLQVCGLTLIHFDFPVTTEMDKQEN